MLSRRHGVFILLLVVALTHISCDQTEKLYQEQVLLEYECDSGESYNDDLRKLNILLGHKNAAKNDTARFLAGLEKITGCIHTKQMNEALSFKEIEGLMNKKGRIRSKNPFLPLLVEKAVDGVIAELLINELILRYENYEEVAEIAAEFNILDRKQEITMLLENNILSEEYSCLGKQAAPAFYYSCLFEKAEKKEMPEDRVLEMLYFERPAILEISTFETSEMDTDRYFRVAAGVDACIALLQNLTYSTQLLGHVPEDYIQTGTMLYEMGKLPFSTNPYTDSHYNVAEVWYLIADIKKDKITHICNI